MAIITFKKNATVFDLVEQMKFHFGDHVTQAAHTYFLFAGGDGFEIGRNIFDYLKTLKYKADGTKQRIRSPKNLMLNGVGDCKSYSVFSAANLFCFGYPVRWVYSTSTQPDQPDHVYTQFLDETGIVRTLDATICCYDKVPFSIDKWETEWMQ